ncbi:MAG: GIY-YIG nuclease family protein [Deltaproteobacteria bacterium]|nr:GIY-YIG nuclease family protein [Deltaproteobacteria bacterium]
MTGGKNKIHNHKNANSNGFSKNPNNINRNGINGQRGKTKLKKLIKDLCKLEKQKNITEKEKILIYQIYEIAISDYVYSGSVNANIYHLYFMESDFGIKIGKSQKIENRLKQIRNYAKTTNILKIIPFAGTFETKLHKKFKKQNIKNNPVYGIEWFYKNDDLINFIKNINNVNDLVSIFGGKRAKQIQMEF